MKMKTIVLISLLTIIITALAGCTDSDEPDHKDSNKTQLLDPNAVRSVDIQGDAESRGSLTDAKSIQRFVEAIHTAEYDRGQLDISAPNYVAVATLENNEDVRFSFWIKGVGTGLFMKSGQEGHYRLPETARIVLADLFHSVTAPPAEASLATLEFRTERNADGGLVARPVGLAEDNYHLSGGPAIERQGIFYHTIQLFYGDHKAINALVAHDPSTDEVQVKWSDQMVNFNNRWNNAFMRSYDMLIPWNDDQLLFLESELTEDGGQYHLSSYNVATGAIERIREDFWPLADNYDYIYKLEWDADAHKLFMQSYLGNVWIFDLLSGNDDVHHLKYRVIPHSTMGVPSLFLSPTFERFVHDDESGELAFYDHAGNLLRSVPLPTEHYVPSEKIKWNPAGTIAWMYIAEADENRILEIDIDYLRIAPQQINFYNPDGLLLDSVQAEGTHSGAALEVAGWMDEQTAVMKSYTIRHEGRDYVDEKAANISYYLYNVSKKERGETVASMPPDAIATPVYPFTAPIASGTSGATETSGDREPVLVSDHEITYFR